MVSDVDCVIVVDKDIEDVVDVLAVVELDSDIDADRVGDTEADIELDAVTEEVPVNEGLTDWLGVLDGDMDALEVEEVL